MLSFSFFFSSRRRHTRSKRDWSSDVCSSDLSRAPRRSSKARRGISRRATRSAPSPRGARDRSEERRVGKECRSRGWPYHEKKNIFRFMLEVEFSLVGDYMVFLLVTIWMY